MKFIFAILFITFISYQVSAVAYSDSGNDRINYSEKAESIETSYAESTDDPEIFSISDNTSRLKDSKISITFIKVTIHNLHYSIIEPPSNS